MKPFLLIVGDRYYPSQSTDDWIKTFSSREDAENYVIENYVDFEENLQWYNIVDLREWMNKE